jgi:hypothetical protein
LLKKTEALEAKINSMQKLNGRATKPPKKPLDPNGYCSTAKHVRPQEQTITLMPLVKTLWEDCNVERMNDGNSQW